MGSCVQSSILGFSVTALQKESGVADEEEIHELADKFLDISHGQLRVPKNAVLFRFRQCKLYNHYRALESLYNTFDVDGSGDIDFREYVLWVAKMRRNDAQESADMTFRLFDVNHDGSISLEELEEIFFFLNSTLEIVEFTGIDAGRALASPAEFDELAVHDEAYYRRQIARVARDIFAEFDADKNGVLDFDEFKRALDKYAFLRGAPFRCLSEGAAKGLFVPSHTTSADTSPIDTPRAADALTVHKTNEKMRKVKRSW